MKQTNEPMGERVDKDILFSKTVKAGKRVYYIDVKRDRRDALYLSITESKRVREGNEEERPVFEKHKIFLYREDLEKFMSAITAAADFAVENSPSSDLNFVQNKTDEWSKPEDMFSCVDRGASGSECAENESKEASSTANLAGGKIKIDLDF